MSTAATALVERVRSERSCAPAERPTRASDTSLDRVVELLEDIADRLDGGRPLGSVPDQLGHLVTDSWDWKADLTSRVLQYKHGLMRAGKG